MRKNDRVRFIDPVKDKENGILRIFEIKGEYAICGKGDFENLGKNFQTVKLSELKIEK